MGVIKMNILIVDDEIDTLKDIDYYVQKYNKLNSTVLCINPLEALNQAEKICFDIALLDIELPAMDGLELAERLFEICPKIKIVFITAYNNYATEAFNINAIDYVLKPIREERLFKALDRLFYKKIESVHEKDNKAELYVYMFKNFIVKSGQETIKWDRQKAFELFAYLLENRNIPIHKEKLCDLFWPDSEPKKALVNLQTSIYSIRKTLEKYNNYEISIEYSVSNYILNTKKVWIDVVEFETILQKAIHLKDINLLKNGISIYSGEYLDEEGWMWSEPKKQELRKKYKIALENLKILGI
jgi:two-component SAPR family response regulator